MAISLRTMTEADIDLGMRLKRQAGWNQTQTDWKRFLELEPEGCFVAQWDGCPVATTTSVVFAQVGWIAMVLVDPSFRHRGIATALVQRAIEYLRQRGVKTVRLDATRYGRPVYRRMGFVEEYTLARFQGIAQTEEYLADPPTLASGCSEALLELDRCVSDTERDCLLQRLMRDHPEYSRTIFHGDDLAGYLMMRPGSDAWFIGPAAATHALAGQALVTWALAECVGQPVLIDIPLRNKPAIQWAAKVGLAEQRRFARMCYGPPIDDRPEKLWASSGPEMG